MPPEFQSLRKGYSSYAIDTNNPDTMERGPPIEPDLRELWQNSDGVDLEAHIYFPRSAKTDKQRCPVFWIVPGGGFVQNNLEDYPRALVTILQELGILVCITCYRTLPEATFSEMFEDVVDGGLWIHDNLQEVIWSHNIWIESKEKPTPKIYACGFSAGACLLLLVVPYIKLHRLILFYGCFDINVEFPDKGRLSQANNPQPDLTPDVVARATDYDNPPRPGVQCFPDQPERLDARKSLFHSYHQNGDFPTFLLGSYRDQDGQFCVPNKEQITQQQINDWNPIHRIESGRHKIHCPIVIIDATQDEVFQGHGSRLKEVIKAQGGEQVTLVKVEGGHAFDVDESTEEQCQYVGDICRLVLIISGISVHAVSSSSNDPDRYTNGVNTEMEWEDEAWHCRKRIIIHDGSTKYLL